MRVDSKRLAAAATAVASLSMLCWASALARKHSRKKPPPKIIPIQSQVSVQNGKTVITISPQAQKLAGIAVAPLQKSSARRQISAPATVLPVEDLAKLRKSYVAAAAQLAKDHAKAEVSRKAYAQLKSFEEKNANVSQIELQSEQRAWRSDEDDVEAAQKALALVGQMVRQNWGSVVEQWVKDGDPLLMRVLDQKDLLVKITVPLDQSSVPPEHAQLVTSDKHRVQGSLVSPYPQADPRTASVALLYRAAAHPGLAPGAKLTTQLAVGERTSGVIVPDSAVVWSEGKSWVYLETAPGRYLRRSVEVTQPVEKGFFVPLGLSPGDKIVIQGAQIILAEEVRTQGQDEAGTSKTHY